MVKKKKGKNPPKLLSHYSLLEHRSYLKISVKVHRVLGALKKIKEFSVHYTFRRKILRVKIVS